MKILASNFTATKTRNWRPKAIYTAEKVKHFPLSIKDILVGEPRNGKDLRAYTTTGIPYIRVSDLKRYTINYVTTKYVEAKVPSSIQLKIDDVLVTRKGTPGIATIVTDQDKAAYIGSEIIKLAIKKSYEPTYIAAYLNSKLFYQILLSNLTGTISTGINHPALKSMKVYYEPQLVEKVVERAKQMSEFDQKAMKLVNQARTLLQSKLAIPAKGPYNETSFSINFSDIREDLWTPHYYNPKVKYTEDLAKQMYTTVRLGAVCSVVAGSEPGRDAYKEYFESRQQDVPFIRTSDLVNYEIDVLTDYYIAHEIYDELNQDIAWGDILFTKDGKVGMAALITESDKAIFAAGVARLRLNANAKQLQITPEYLFTLLSLKEVGINGAKRRAVTASTIPHITPERLKNIIIPICDKTTLEKTTSLIREAFLLKDKKKQLAKEIEQLFSNEFSDIQF